MRRHAVSAGLAEAVPGLIALMQSLLLVVSGPATSPEYLPLRVAEAEGLFAREGLAVRVRTTRAEPGAAEALAQGQADLVATSLDAILRFGPREPTQTPRLVFGLTAAPPVALLIPSGHGDIVKSVEHLPGTRVGLASPGAPEHAWFGWLLARAGLSPAQIWIVSHGPRGLVAAVETNDVHAGLVPEPAASRLVADGHAHVLLDLRTPAGVTQALGAPTVHAAVFVRSDRRPRDSDLTAFARAVLAAERRIATATPESLATRLPAPVVAPGADFAVRVAATRGIYLPDGLVTAEQVQETIALIRAHAPLPATPRLPKPDDLLHAAPLRRALMPVAR